MDGIIVSTLFLLLCQLALSCSPVKWEKWSMERILDNQAIVVYGKETERFNSLATDTERQDAWFTVYCVLKNDNITRPIPERIIIEEVSPRHTCSGTKVTTGKDVILGLTRVESTGNFTWDEPNVTPDGGSFDYTSEILAKVTLVCGLQKPVSPQGRDPNSQLPACPQVPQTDECVSSACRATVHSAVLLSMITYLGIAVFIHQ